MIRPVTAVIQLCMLVACNIYDNYPVEDEAPNADPNGATLVLKVGLATPTRADNDRENMHSLRVVLLDADGKVEYNDYINSSSRPDLFDSKNDGTGLTEFDYSQYRYIRTRPGKKKIFLIANEESVGSVQSANGDFTSLTEALASKQVGDSGFEAFANSIYFKPDFSKNIVISSMYEFEIPEKVLETEDHRYIPEQTFWLVRAAAKFQFFFENHRYNPVTIDNLTISSVADDTYLMGHVGATEYTKDGIYWVDWLKKVSDATTANPDDPENDGINGRYGWLTDYTIPQTAHKELNVKNAIAGDKWVIDQYADNAEPWTLPPVYCSESRNMSGDEQNYTLTITLTDDDGKPQTFTEDLDLELPALFRNTSVRVKIALYGDSQLQVNVMLTAWDNETSGDITFN